MATRENTCVFGYGFTFYYDIRAIRSSTSPFDSKKITAVQLTEDYSKPSDLKYKIDLFVTEMSYRATVLFV